MSRTLELNTIKVQALKNLDILSNRKNVTEIIEKMAKLSQEN